MHVKESADKVKRKIGVRGQQKYALFYQQGQIHFQINMDLLSFMEVTNREPPVSYSHCIFHDANQIF